MLLQHAGAINGATGHHTCAQKRLRATHALADLLPAQLLRASVTIEKASSVHRGLRHARAARQAAVALVHHPQNSPRRKVKSFIQHAARSEHPRYIQQQTEVDGCYFAQRVWVSSKTLDLVDRI